jgi:hypothetical protein
MAIDEIVGDSIDRAVNIEMRFRAGLPRGVTYPLYEAARKKQKKPLTWLAAKLLKDKVTAGQHVFVVTGAGTPPGLPAGETDGPPGAAAIARAIEFGLGAKPILISEARNMPAVIKSAEAAGIAVVDEALFKQRRSCALAIDYPLGDAAGKKRRHALQEVEAGGDDLHREVGPNTRAYHSIMGTAHPDKIASACLADFAGAAASRRSASATAATDRLRRHQQAVREIQPSARIAAAPAMAALARLLNATSQLFAAVSNWGRHCGGAGRSPGTAKCCTTRQRAAHRARKVAGAWTRFPASSPTSTASDRGAERA